MFMQAIASDCTTKTLALRKAQSTGRILVCHRPKAEHGGTEVVATYYGKPTLTGNDASRRAAGLEQEQCAACALRGEVFCRTLDKAESLLALKEKTVTYPRDTSIFEEGEKPGFLGVLKRGYLRGEHVNSDGRRMILWLIRPGDLVGCFPGHSASYSLEVASTAEICHFNEAGLAKMMAKSPRFRRQVLRGILELRDKQLDFLWLRSALSSKERLIAFLVIMAKFMPTSPMPDGSLIITIDLSRRDWADMSNTSVETISRSMTKLSQIGLVESLPQNRYRIHDLVALAGMVGMKVEPKTSPSLPPSIAPGGHMSLLRNGAGGGKDAGVVKTVAEVGPESAKPASFVTPHPMR
ncbi:Crp/Fnr family transcriptional regulator [Antarcticimicrobium sediminis]|uniref:Crp/Fnr family transcriptional regulator n=1 Tax=Antarcticimicrobium sediminis TaxID=2546227 RepID=A0A4R5EZT2_9RHOB|nr:Crp/Fnr family transcriptional regulator [Antarcticimicrobium sediminis]TDE40675.1 Crp/Fnr family transcriptional regulator [Antarcticimicrobium sediminis]